MKCGHLRSAILVITVGVLLCLTEVIYAYTVPNGIPDPSAYFNGFDPINMPAPTVNADGTCERCANWPSSENPGCYFIDNSDPNATDSDNPYGYPDRPRLTIPEISYSAGDFVYINGGMYSSKGDRFNWGGVGTAASPIWFCGNPLNRPKLLGPNYLHFYVNTHYFIMDNIEFTSNARISIRPTSSGVRISHLVIRNCSFEGTQSSSDGGAISVGQTTGDPYDGSFISDVVIFNNHMRNYGDVYSTEQCGVYMGFPTERLWVLENEIHHFGADGVAGCHNADHGARYSRYYFIGDNKIYDNGENAIDLKAIEHYVISHNDLAGPHYREQGWAVVLHYGAYSLGCTHGWVLFNDIHDAGGGIALTNVNKETFIIGNTIHNIYAKDEKDALNGAGIGFRGMDGLLIIASNTISDYERYGIVCDQETLSLSDSAVIENNIIANPKDDGYAIHVDDGEERITLRNNLFYNPNGTVKIFWDNASRTLDYLQCSGCIESSPGFVNPPFDFSLKATSPCIDKGIESSAYNKFQSEYSINIKKDFLGKQRPQGDGWDIGAFEYVEGSGGTGSPPPTPTNLRIQ